MLYDQAEKTYYIGLLENETGEKLNEICKNVSPSFSGFVPFKKQLAIDLRKDIPMNQTRVYITVYGFQKDTALVRETLRNTKLDLQYPFYCYDDTVAHVNPQSTTGKPPHELVGQELPDYLYAPPRRHSANTSALPAAGVPRANETPNVVESASDPEDSMQIDNELELPLLMACRSGPAGGSGADHERDPIPTDETWDIIT
ncbi:hypothetical protein BO78DRAFT_416463 [Aspergillus sclerotiicarbonarius CBS 121057]|uniref:Uncharacterized protein n=1 Tax=Aspergillus sclerotiicarbonarius (strain CBS 121057 / IBT 28362) TaxID=1448318 RepID=A0A319EEE4_ASPSB|nr:hypothetical protein BO78DRAFT_416463 [Aspergillus sclerotiicarbonarius CBS 121057]